MATRNTAASRGQQDAIAMLKEDHARVKRLAEQFERTDDDERKRKLADRICQELEVHTRLEEEIFYPATRVAVGDDDMMDEAQVEHDSAKDLIRQIKSMSPGDAMYDAKVKVLAEYVNHHVEEEETEMFKKARRAKVDVVELGRRMAERRQALEAEHSMEPFDTISAMLMMPIRAAASAARAGVAAGRRASAGTSKSKGTRATGTRATGTRATGTRTATSATRAATGATRGATRTATRATATATRAAGTTARKAAGAATRATASSGRGTRSAAGSTGGRATASTGRKAATGTKRATAAGSARSPRADSGGRHAVSPGGRSRQAEGGRKGGSSRSTAGRKARSR